MGTGHHHHHHDSDHHHSHAHHADHQHILDDLNSKDAVKRIKWAFCLNMAFALIELIGGVLIGSFAIIADAIHDFGDSLSLALALFLQKKSGQAPSPEFTYGYQRYSVLSSLLSGTIIVVGSFVICIESVTHLVKAEAIPNVPWMIGLALLGILANGLAAFGLSHGHSHNEKILSWHLIEDLLGWVAVLVGAICIQIFQVAWIDPLLAIGISLFILYNVARNMREPLRIILQEAPSPKELTQLKHELAHLDGVMSLSQVHAWTLDGRQHVFSGCLKLRRMDEALVIKQKARSLIESKGYRFITIEIDQGDEAKAH